MIVELDRICDLIEWRIEPNRIQGRIRTQALESCHHVVIRLEGYSVHERLKKRTDAQVSIALEIIKDLYHDRLFNTVKSGNQGSPDDKPKPKRGAGDKDAPKASRGTQPKNKKRAGRPAGRSTGG